MKKSKRTANKNIRKKEENLCFKSRKIKIRVVGIGGGGVSIISEMAPHLKQASFVAADTDSKVFQKLKSRARPFQFGSKTVKGVGTGMDAELAQRLALEEKAQLARIFQDQDISILISCLGGGVGSGASPVFAEAARAQKNITLGIFTLPFHFEGERKMNMAKRVIDKLGQNLSGVVVIPNEKIFQFIDKRTPLKKALSTLNQMFTKWLVEWIEIILKPGLINIDFADLRTILQGQGARLFLGQAMAQGPNRAEEVLKNIFNQSLYEGPPKTVKRILFNISGGKDLGIKEVEVLSQAIFRLNPRAKIIFGVNQEPKYNGKLKLSVLAVSEAGKKTRAMVLEPRKTIRRSKTSNSKKKNLKTKERNSDLASPAKEGAAMKKDKIRQTALQVKETEKAAEEKEWANNWQWDIPAFLKNKTEE